MDRRTLLALVLTAIVIVATPILFPTQRQPRGVDSLALAPDSLSQRARDTARLPQPPATQTPTPNQPTIRGTRPATPAAPAPARVETTTVRTRHAVLRFSSHGATPVD